MRKSILYLFTILILILQLINQLLLQVPTILFVVLFVFIFLLSEKKQIIGIFLYLILISSGNLLYIVNVLFVSTLIIKFRKNLIINRSVILLLIIVLIETIHVFINNNLGINESVVKLLGFSICLIPFGIIKSFSNYIDIKQTFYLFVLGFISFTLITINIYIFDYNLTNYFTEIKRFGFMPNKTDYETNTILINPNTIGKYSALIVSSFLILYSFKKIKMNFSNFLMLIYVIFIGFLTLSRAFLLVTIIILLFYIISNFNKKNIVTNMLLFISLIIGFLIIFANSNLRSSLYNRIFETDDISGSRILIYNQYIEVIKEQTSIFLFGTGMQDYLFKFTKYNNEIYQATHNLFLEIISIWGILGFIILAIYTLILISESNFIKIKNRQKQLLIILPLLTIIISAQFGQYFISYYHTFSVTIFSLLFMFNDEVIDK
nr:O-antigen ligase family protein [Mammaliicoccus lentus]